MKNLAELMNPFLGTRRLQKPKTNTEINLTNQFQTEVNLINEFQFDIEWWEKSFAIEWWNINGHFNDTLYRDYLFAKIDRNTN